MVEGIDAEVKKQVEYYLSDDNLERDSFFHDKIKNSKDVNNIYSFPTFSIIFPLGLSIS